MSWLRSGPTDTHPMRLHADSLARFTLCRSIDLPHYVGRHVMMAGMLTTAKPVHTIQDEPMVVDSNIIIDGRLADLCSTGFVSSVEGVEKSLYRQWSSASRRMSTARPALRPGSFLARLSYSRKRSAWPKAATPTRDPAATCHVPRRLQRPRLSAAPHFATLTLPRVRIGSNARTAVPPPRSRSPPATAGGRHR